MIPIRYLTLHPTCGTFWAQINLFYGVDKRRLIGYEFSDNCNNLHVLTRYRGEILDCQHIQKESRFLRGEVVSDCKQCKGSDFGLIPDKYILQND